MRRPFEVDGVDYTPEGIRDLRKELIILRDEALAQNEFRWAVILSHTVVLLAWLAEGGSVAKLS